MHAHWSRRGSAWQAGLALLLFLTACSGSLADEAPPAASFYLPPTAITTATQPAPVSPVEIAAPQVGAPPSPDCQPNLSFIQDLSIPDGTQVAPGELLDKLWEVENSGTCNWEASYRIRLVAGPEMGAPQESALYPARSGAQVVLRMKFTAPAEPGVYRSAWQAVDPLGELFGDPFFIEIEVAPPATPTPSG